MQKGFVAKMAPVGKLFDKVRLPEIARESGCHYVVNCTVSKPSLVEKVVRNAVLIAREIGPTYLQLYTPCILEIGKNSMEGLQEMRDSEKPAERFAYKEYISEPAKQLLAERDRQGQGKESRCQTVSRAKSLRIPEVVHDQEKTQYSHVGIGRAGCRHCSACNGHGGQPGRKVFNIQSVLWCREAYGSRRKLLPHRHRADL